MPCPFVHAGEAEPEPLGPGATPLDRIIDWYVRDVNISRRIGWTHGPPPEPVQRIYEWVNSALETFMPAERGHALPMGGKVEAILERLQPEPQKGAFPPLVNESMFGPEVNPPVPHGKRPGLFFLEQAFTTMLAEERFGAWLPAKKEFSKLGSSTKPFPSVGGSGTPAGGGTRRGEARRMPIGQTQVNWTEVVQQMTSLVGGQTPVSGGPPANTVQQGEI